MVSEGDPKPSDGESDPLNESPVQPSQDDVEHTVPPDSLERISPGRREEITRAFSSVTQVTTPIFNPILERFTSDHVSRMIDNEENENIREHNSENSRRRYLFAYFLVVVCVVVGLIVFFVASDNRDLIAPLVAAVAGFLGGFAAGQRFRP